MFGRLNSTVDWVRRRLGVRVRGETGVSGTPFRVRTQETSRPGVVVAIAPRPRAIICHPFRMEIRGLMIIESLEPLGIGRKALGESVPCGRWTRRLRPALRWMAGIGLGESMGQCSRNHKKYESVNNDSNHRWLDVGGLSARAESWFPKSAGNQSQITDIRIESLGSSHRNIHVC
jgi:hypothetical protein